jgi:hypothetical protein
VVTTLAELLDSNESFYIYRLELRDAVYSYLTELGMATSQNNSTPDLSGDEPETAVAIDDPIYQSLLEDEDEGEDPESTLDPSSKELKQLFRKIVTLTHPDKVQHMTGLSDDEMHDRFQIYQQACTAFELRLMDDLIELAVYLSIDVDIPIEVKISKIKSQIKKADAELGGIRQTVEWTWGVNFGNNDARARILSAVCRQMGAQGIPDDMTLKFIERYDSNDSREARRKVGERPAARKSGTRPEKY